MSSMRSGGVQDRYAVPSEANRRGAHRARPNSVTGALPVVGVAVVVIAALAGAFVLLGSGLFPSTANSTNSSRLPGFSPIPVPTSLPNDLPVQATRTPPPATALAASRAAAQASVKLVVLNSTTTAGLAKKAAAALHAKGWTILRTGNFTGEAPPVTTVFYGPIPLAGTANLVATDLGQLQIAQSSENAPIGITVVLGTDYHP